MIRRIVFYKNHFVDFFQTLDSKVQEKIEYVFYIIRNSEIIPSRFFKSIKNAEGLFEIRIQHGNNNYRIFCFLDESQLVVLINALQKKSQKIPRRDIIKAQKLKENYFKEKNKPG